MQILKTDSNNFRIECNHGELDILRNALNNIPQAVDECEYTTLIGATKEETDQVLATLVNALRN